MAPPEPSTTSEDSKNPLLEETTKEDHGATLKKYFNSFSTTMKDFVNSLEQLTKVNLSLMDKKDQEQYLTLIYEYRAIIGKTVIFSSKQIPIFELLIELLENKDLTRVTQLIPKIEFNTAGEILEQCIDLQNKAVNLQRKLESDERYKTLNITKIAVLITAALLGAACIAAVIVFPFVLPIDIALACAGGVALVGFGACTPSIIQGIKMEKMKCEVDDAIKSIKYVNGHLQTIKQDSDNISQRMTRLDHKLTLNWMEGVESLCKDILGHLKEINEHCLLKPPSKKWWSIF